jgi:hypothetical protein
MKRHDFSMKVIEAKESVLELSSLDELYSSLVSCSTKDENEKRLRTEEAKFARERMLKLSLHVKNLLSNLEKEENL